MSQHKQALPEQQRQAMIDRLNKTVAANPRYSGLTIVEAVRRILKAGPQPRAKAPRR